MVGCNSGSKVRGTDIPVPDQYGMDIRVDRKKHPCEYDCAVAHERVHERQCTQLGGTRYNAMTEAQKDIPAYVMQLGCFLRMQYEYRLGPYRDYE